MFGLGNINFFFFFFFRYPATHPFASLQGSDNIIKFTTKYFPNGVIIQVCQVK